LWESASGSKEKNITLEQSKEIYKEFLSSKKVGS